MLASDTIDSIAKRVIAFEADVAPPRLIERTATSRPDSMGFTIVGIVLEMLGLVVAAVGLIRAWQSAYGSEFSFWTGKRKVAIHLRVFGIRLSSAPVVEIPPTSSDVEGRLDRLEAQALTIRNEFDFHRNTVEQKSEQLREQVGSLARTVQVESAEKLRVDTRLAAVGLAIVVVGSVFQLVGVLIPA